MKHIKAAALSVLLLVMCSAAFGEELPRTSSRHGQKVNMFVSVSDDNVRRNMFMSTDQSGRSCIPAAWVGDFKINAVGSVEVLDVGKSGSKLFLVKGTDIAGAPVKNGMVYLDDVPIVLQGAGDAKPIKIGYSDLFAKGIPDSMLKGSGSSGKHAGPVKRRAHGKRTVLKGGDSRSKHVGSVKHRAHGKQTIHSKKSSKR